MRARPLGGAAAGAAWPASRRRDAPVRGGRGRVRLGGGPPLVARRRPPPGLWALLLLAP
jgi:hypothetical protein